MKAYGIFIDMTGTGDFKRVEKFPIFIEKYVADAYLNKYVNITGIKEYVVLKLDSTQQR
jgi:hypothetical protein